MASPYHSEIEKRLAERNLTLPDAMAPAANYIPFKLSGGFLYISGQLPSNPDGSLIKGLCGVDITTEDAMQAAEKCAINILAQARAAVGDFENIAGLTKMTGFVASAPDFGEQPAVVNGASNFMVEILGDRGRHTRSAVGVAALPFGVAVEVEAIFELKS